MIAHNKKQGLPYKNLFVYPGILILMMKILQKILFKNS